MQWFFGPHGLRDIARNVVGAGAAALAVLSAAHIADAAQPAGVPHPVAAQRAHAWIDARYRQAIASATQPLVYVSQAKYGTVLAYPTGTAVPPQSPVETISDLRSPNALAVDAAQDLYVSEGLGYDVQVFAPGQIAPSKTLASAPGSAPYVGLAIDGHGTVYALMTTGGIDVYRNGATAPAATLSDPSILFPISIAADSSGNVYVSYFGTDGVLTDGVFVAATSVGFGTFHHLLVDAKGSAASSNPQSLAIDRNGDLLVADVSVHPELRVYPAGTQTMTARFPVGGNGNFLFALTSGNHHVFVAPYNLGVIDEYAFPGGQRQSEIALPVSLTDGIATSPASPLGTW